jgi:hypothetical protein
MSELKAKELVEKNLNKLKGINFLLNIAIILNYKSKNNRNRVKKWLIENGYQIQYVSDHQTPDHWESEYKIIINLKQL